MPKRYKGGLISATPPVTSSSVASSIWSLAEHFQGSNTATWPKTSFQVLQTGTSIYDATYAGAVASINEFDSNPAVYSNIPTVGYLKYKLKVPGGGTSDIVVSYRKVSGSLIQSAFSLFGATLSYVDSGVSVILNSANDDHDSLFMDADGKGVLSRTQTSQIGDTVNQWTKFQGTSTAVGNNTIDNVVTYPVTSFISAVQYGTLVSFPLTNSGIWFNLSAGTYKLNNLSGVAMPSLLSTTIGTATQTNSLWSVSDGVNQFIMGRYGTTQAVYCVVNFWTGAMTASAINYPTNVVQSNNTEEDAIGTQLFTVDGFITYHKDKYLYYGGTYTWREFAETWTAGTGKAQFLAGPGSTNPTLQTDMDIFGSVDTDRSVWFADWGHDDGGLYNVGNDIELGTRKTNIKLIATNYTN